MAGDGFVAELLAPSSPPLPGSVPLSVSRRSLAPMTVGLMLWRPNCLYVRWRSGS
jgi:hypothetical protein